MEHYIFVSTFPGTYGNHILVITGPLAKPKQIDVYKRKHLTYEQIKKILQISRRRTPRVHGKTRTPSKANKVR